MEDSVHAGRKKEKWTTNEEDGPMDSACWDRNRPLRPKPEMFDDDFSFVPLNSGSRHNVDQHSLHSKVVLPRYQKKSKKSEQVV